ncbi:fibronectin type III-like domain-contianing protein [Saccharopolyspora sp. NPDC000995]
MSFTLAARVLSYRDEASGGWRIGPGRYVVMIGESSQDIRPNQETGREPFGLL